MSRTIREVLQRATAPDGAVSRQELLPRERVMREIAVGWIVVAPRGGIVGHGAAARGSLRGGVKAGHLRGCPFRVSEGMPGVFRVEVYATVRRYVLLEGHSRREAAGVFGLSRDTIAKMCRFSVPPGYQRSKPWRVFCSILPGRRSLTLGCIGRSYSAAN